jgi:hypothetical protein
MFATLVTLAPPPALRTRTRDVLLPVGFGLGTQIRTICGTRAVENLMAGDLLLDATGQIAELRGVRRSVASKHDLVQIDPSAMGLGLAPGDLTRPLVVAAGQKLAIRDWRTDIVFGAPALTQARALVDNLHVRAGVTGARVIVELMFDQPTVVLANGLNALVAATE